MTVAEIVLQYVHKGLLNRGIAVSDGKTYRVWRDKTKTFKVLERIARDTTMKLPVFFSAEHKPYKRLRKILDEGTAEPNWKAGPEGPWTGRFDHSMPKIDQGRRSPDNSWWHMTTPVDFTCSKCEAPFPTFGEYHDGYYHCHGCGYRDFDVSSVGV
jgi:DNA-directed RNA polymerase subunit RPC12/RpoP